LGNDPPVKTAVVLQQTPSEGPGRLADLLAAHDIRCDVRAVYGKHGVPAALADDQLLIVMGGPMGVADADRPELRYLADEIALLRGLVARDAPVLGICLGAQLLAAAAGARVYPNTRPGPDGAPVPAREVGWGPVDLVVRDEPALAGLGAREMVLHWHGDTFDLPPGAVHLASTPACRHQAFRLGRRQFGLQFHCELTSDAIADWVRGDAAYVRETLGPDGGAQILADTDRYHAAALPIWDRLLGNIVSIMHSGT
jgi:GMP synthase (glutamine-hydrolysing)